MTERAESAPPTHSLESRWAVEATIASDLALKFARWAEDWKAKAEHALQMSEKARERGL